MKNDKSEDNSASEVIPEDNVTNTQCLKLFVGGYCMGKRYSDNRL